METRCRAGLGQRAKSKKRVDEVAGALTLSQMAEVRGVHLNRTWMSSVCSYNANRYSNNAFDSPASNPTIRTLTKKSNNKKKQETISHP